MAVRKPLILDKTSGKIKELPSGDSIQETVIGFSGLNNTGGAIAKGVPVTKTATTTEIALANSTDNTKPCVGLTAGIITDGTSGAVQTNDTITLADWTTITGSASLTPNTNYFLDTTDGLLTNDVSTYVAGNVVQKVGKAVSSTDLLIQLDEPILLS